LAVIATLNYFKAARYNHLPQLIMAYHHIQALLATDGGYASFRYMSFFPPSALVVL
jgi:hypothetical protein